jgi:hypothetical protein
MARLPLDARKEKLMSESSVNGHVPGNTCSWWLRIEAAGNLIIMWSVMGRLLSHAIARFAANDRLLPAILQLRLYGLYNKSRRIGIFLVTGYIIQAALSILVYGTAVRFIEGASSAAAG